MKSVRDLLSRLVIITCSNVADGTGFGINRRTALSATAVNHSVIPTDRLYNIEDRSDRLGRPVAATIAPCIHYVTEIMIA